MTEKRVRVIATGRTFPVKEDLKYCGFRWDTAREAWTAFATQGECSLFRYNVSAGIWDGVDLEFINNTDNS